MIFRHKFLLPIFLLLQGLFLQAQVRVEGQVRDKETGRPLQYAFVVVLRTQNGIFCDTQGRFAFQTQADDTLLISQTGYLLEKVFLKDYPGQNPIRLDVRIGMKSVQLPVFTVKAPKTYDQILQELESEERRKAMPETPLTDAVSSPITYLYQQFSRQEQSKRKIAELRSEDAKTALFRELFTRYMVTKIINLDEEDMDDFIAWSQIGSAYRKFDSEYDLVVFVKEQFRLYQIERKR